jgi:preprotein translocase subunit SecE
VPVRNNSSVNHAGISNQRIMNKFFTFLRDSYEELMDRVSWPKWSSLQQSTMIVIGATLLIIAIVALMDLIANNALKFIYTTF